MSTYQLLRHWLFLTVRDSLRWIWMRTNIINFSFYCLAQMHCCRVTVTLFGNRHISFLPTDALSLELFRNSYKPIHCCLKTHAMMYLSAKIKRTYYNVFLQTHFLKSYFPQDLKLPSMNDPLMLWRGNNFHIDEWNSVSNCCLDLKYGTLLEFQNYCSFSWSLFIKMEKLKIYVDPL